MSAKQPPEDKYIKVNGLNLHYLDWGGHSNTTLVALHGITGNSHMWDSFAERNREEFRILALDQRGHGDSAKPDHGYDFATVSEDLLGLINARDIRRPIIAGHSWGGDVALEFAVANPGAVKGLCFVDGGMIEPSARHSSLQQARDQMAPPVFSGVTREEFSERVRSRHAEDAMAARFAEIVLANFETLEDNTSRAKLSRDNHIRIIEALWDHHPPALYPQVKCPVLMMPARRQGDPAAAERNERRAKSVASAAQLLPAGKAVWLDDSIHDVPVQRPELVAGVIKEHIHEGFFDRSAG